MTKGIKGKEPNARIVYGDIIDLPHHISTKHSHMSLYDRAAQFMPFAALTGYEDMVNEEARITDNAILLEDSIKDLISQKINLISEAIKKGVFPTVAITYFVPDTNKSGGKYITVKEQVKKIDTVKQKIILMRTKEISQVNETINIENITDIRGDLVDYLDEFINQIYVP